MMELLSALFRLEQMEPFCSLPTGRFLLLPQHSVPALHTQPGARNCLSSHPGVWSQIPASHHSLALADLSPLGPGLQPPGSRAELLYSNPQQLCLHPTTATQSPAARGWPQEKAFHLVQKCLAEGFLFPGVPMPSPSISQADAVQRVTERPQKMQPAATAQGGVTKVKEEFWKFQQEHTPESPKPLLPATVFTFISWSEEIF